MHSCLETGLSTHPGVNDGNISLVLSIYDGLQILYSTGDEGAEHGSPTGVARLSVADVVGPAHSAHVSTENPVCCHQMNLTRTHHTINILYLRQKS